MGDLKVAIMLGSLRLEPYEGMRKAVEMGATGLHISAGGDWDARTMPLQARKDLVVHLRGLGLEISAISCWGGEVDLTEEENWRANIEWGKRNLELAADLECCIWQGHCGIMPEDPTQPGWQRIIEGMAELAVHGEQVGACLAVETGPEPPYVLRRLVTTLGSPAIRINWDPANMILWPPMFAQRLGEPYQREKWIERFQPNEGARALADVIVHTHAKDALVREDGTGQEVPLGEGWVDWPRYVGYLREAGYDGYFAIEREVGDNPVADIQKAVNFLKSL
jgi:sugar phosphate isomerase/epimerase